MTAVPLAAPAAKAATTRSEAIPASWDDLASFVRYLESRGELRRVSREIDPVLEISALAQRAVRAGGPALLFEHVKGSRYPLLINTYATRQRMSWALGVGDLDEHARAILALVKSQPPAGLMDKVRMLPKLARVASATPKIVRSGPCQQVVETEPDLTKLPVLTTWPGDGGPYITLPMVITRDPDKGTRNVGCYRMQVYDGRTTGMHWQLHKTGRRHMRRYKELGQTRMPVAVALGGDPVLPYAATAPLPDGIDEFLFAGFLRRKPVELVKCKTIDLEVPASADFVLEGYVDVDELRREGPFGDHTGYYSLADDYPVFHLTAITRRESPIYATTVVGPPPQEDAWLGKATERLFPAAFADDLPRDRRHEPADRGGVPQSVPGLDQEGVPAPRAQDLPFAVGHGADDVRQVHRRRRRRRQRAERRRAGLAGAEQHRRQARRLLRRGADRRAGPRVQRVRLRRQAGHRRHPQVEGRRVHARVAGGPEDGRRRRRADGRLLERAGAVNTEPSLAEAGADVKTMFNRVARRYDAANRLMSGGIDIVWRKKAIARLLDGMGDDPRRFWIWAPARWTARSRSCAARRSARVAAADFAREMLRAGRRKIPRRATIETHAADGHHLPYRDDMFDGAFSAFCVRNLSDLKRGLSELRRVVHPAGRVVILEFLRPERPRFFFDRIWNAHVLPALGWAVTGDRAAYRYLPESIARFRSAPEFAALMREVGFLNVETEPLFPSGVATMVVAS